MEMIEFNFKYRGGFIHVKVYPDINYLGLMYLIELDSHYLFTVYQDDKEDWMLMRENDGNIPTVETGLLDNILKKLQRQLKYAA